MSEHEGYFGGCGLLPDFGCIIRNFATKSSSALRSYLPMGLVVVATMLACLGASTGTVNAQVTSCTGPTGSGTGDTHFLLDTNAGTCTTQTALPSGPPTDGFWFKIDEDGADLEETGDSIQGTGDFSFNPTADVTSYSIATTAPATTAGGSCFISTNLGGNIYDLNFTLCSNESFSVTYTVVKDSITYEVIVNLSSVSDGTGGSYTIDNFAITGGAFGGGTVPELDVRNNADTADITNGSSTISTALGTDFGSVAHASGSADNSFRAENNGTDVLTYGSDALAISNTTDFSIQTDLTDSGTSAIGNADTFTIRFDPASAGTKTATVTLRSDDGNEDPYTFDIQGVGTEPPSFGKAFSPTSIAINGTSTIAYAIDNTANAVAAPSLSFTNNLPANVVVAGTPNASTTCTGGRLTASAGAGSISYSGGAANASSSCTVTVDVTSATAGTYNNGAVTLSTSLGNSDSSTASLTVDPAPAFSKAFSVSSIAVNGTSTLTFTIDNSSSSQSATSLDFTDTYPANVVNAGTPNVSTTCTGGTLIAGTGAGSISYSGGTANAGASCTIQVDVTSATAGTYNNLSGALTSNLGDSGTASATLTVDPAPSFSKAFSPTDIAAGGTSTLTFTIDNSGSSQSATSLDFTDTYPSNVVNGSAPNVSTTCTGGTLTASAGAGSISYSGGTVNTGASCTIQVDVTSATAGAYNNTSGTLTSNLGSSGTAAATLNVNDPPPFSKAFSPGNIASGGTSTLTFTIDNSGSTINATTLSFSDTFPTGMTVAGTPNASTNCGGTVTAVANAGNMSFSSGTANAGATCTVTVDVSTTATGNNTSSTLSSGLGTSAAANATLTVSGAPSFTKVFSPTAIAVGGNSTLTFTVDNSAAGISATSLDFIDNLPAGMTVAGTPNASTTCTGGTLTAGTGANAGSYTGGSVGAGSSCTVQFDVTSSTAGTANNTTGDLTSVLGNSGTASATLTINGPPTFANAFSPTDIAVGGTSTLTFTIDNSGSTQSATSLAFTDTYPANVVNASTPNVSTTCTGGTLTASAGAGSISYSGGTANAGVSCTVAVDVTSTTAGTYNNSSGALTSSLGNSGTASASLTVQPAPGFSKAFSPATIASGGTSTLTFSIDNSGSTINATTLSFSDTFPAGLMVAVTPNASTTCGGTVTAVANAGNMSFSSGTASAGTSCMVTVDVTSSTIGTHDNTSGALTSSLGASGTASASLIVDDVPTVAITTGGVTSFDQSAPGTFTATITFSEPVTGFVDGELTASNAAAAMLAPSGGSGTVFTAVITPAGTGDIVLNVAASVAQDAIANDNTAAPTVMVTQNDNVSPTLDPVTLTSDNTDPALALPGNTITLAFTTSEQLAGPPTVTIAGQPAAVGGTAPNLIATLLVDATTALGNVAINISAFQDVVGNPGVAVTTTTDGSAVTVGVDGPTAEETKRVIAQFLLNRANHILSNQPSLIDFVNRSNIRGGGSLGHLAINGNEAGQVLAFSTSRSKILGEMNDNEYASKRIASTYFQPGRRANAGAAGAGLSEDQPGSAKTNVIGDKPLASSHAMAFPSDRNHGPDQELETASLDAVDNAPGRAGTWDAWTQINGARSSSGTAESSLWVGYAGVHYFVDDFTMVGILGQLDWADETDSSVNSNADGIGWMVGPYIAGQIPHQNLFYEARAAWGTSDNEVSPIGTFTDSFDTTRWLASAKINGNYALNNFILTPSLSVSYFEERQDSYSDTNGVFISDQTISLGEVRFGPEFTTTLDFGDGTFFTPTFGLSGVFNFGIKNDVTSQGFLLGNEDLRARLDAGFTMTNGQGVNFRFEGYFDGIGINDYDTYGASVALVVPLY